MTERLSRAEGSRQKREYWKRHIDSWQESGLSQSQYCRQHDLKDHLFFYWKRRIVKPDTATRFVSLNLGSVLTPSRFTAIDQKTLTRRFT